jgi:hypothetical protein
MNSRQRANQNAARSEGIALQPFGLTNFQSKIVGSLVTEQWRTLRGWSSDKAKMMLGGFDVTTGGVAMSHSTAVEWSSGPTGQRACSAHNPRKTRILSAQGSTGPAALIGYDTGRVFEASATLAKDPATHDLARCDSYEQAAQAMTEPSVSNALTGSRALAAAARLVARPPVHWIPVAALAGFPFERAASVAICGADLLYPAISGILMRLVCLDNVLEPVLRTLGIQDKCADYRRFGFVMRAYREGSRMSQVDEAVKIQLLAEFLGRRIVVQLPHQTMLFKPATNSAAGGSTAIPAVVFAGTHVGFVADGEEPVYAYECGTTMTSKSSRPKLSVHRINTDRPAPSKSCTPPAVVDTVLRHIDATKASLWRWFSEELPPCAFALDCSERTYHVEVRTSMLKAGRREAALIEALGFGRDDGAFPFLERSLPDTLVPLHVDADGHCLSHSLSRGLIGKEYLWHALRKGLQQYMTEHREELVAFFKQHPALCGVVEEMDDLIRRADPDQEVKSGSAVTVLGLGTEHIFAFANMLRRPILLIDGSTTHREAYLFLPLLPSVTTLATRAALGVGWYSPERIHYVPIVPRNSNVAPVDVTRYLPIREDKLPQVYGLIEPDDIIGALQRILPAPAHQRTDDISTTWLVEIGGSIADQGSGPIEASPQRGSTAAPGGPAASVTSSMDEHLSRVMGNYVSELFRRRYNVSVWCVHEVARAAAASTSHAEFDALFTNPDIVSLADTCVAKLTNGGDLRYCEDCTGTFFLSATSNKNCKLCHSANSRLSSRIDVSTGAFALRDGALTSDIADPETVGEKDRFKAWVNNEDPPTTPGNYVFARESGSRHSVAKVTASYRDAVIRAEVVDVKFLSGAERFGVPLRDVLNGYPVDLRKVEELDLGELGKQQVPVVVDAHAGLCTNAELAAKRLGANLGLSEHDIAGVQQQLQGAINKLKEGDFTKASGLSSHPSQSMRDADGSIATWESYDAYERRWTPYLEFESMQIESCFATGETSTEIDIAHYGRFEIDFDVMLQRNLHTNHTREIRRLKVKPVWACSVCTFDNGHTNRTCEICNEGVRPKSTTEVTRDADIARREREQRRFTDPALAKGGHLFEIAEGARLRYFNKYKNVAFVLPEGGDRYLPVAKHIDAQHPLFQHLVAMEQQAEVARAVPPFVVDVRLVKIENVRFVRDRDADGNFHEAFVCSLYGKELKTPNFIDFALGDTELHGPSGALFKEGRASQLVTSGITFDGVYGENLFFMLSVKSEFPHALFVPVSRLIRPINPLFADITAVWTDKGRPAYEFNTQGWRLVRSHEGHFEANGTVAALRSKDTTYYGY